MNDGPIERLKFPIKRFVVRHAYGPHGTWFLALMSALESILSPIPLETVLGPLIIARPDRWRYYAAVAISASVVGAIVGYVIGYALYDAIGATILSWYDLSSEVQEASALLNENMFSATFISAFTPIPYKVFVLTAGVLHGPIGIFIIASIFGRGIRFALFSYLVHRFGSTLAQLVFRYFTIATALMVAAVLLLAVVLYL